MGVLGLLDKKTFSHGVHPPEHKEATAGKPIRRLPFAPMLIIPLSQHTGAPAVCLVKEGQEVVRGEPIARAGGFVSVPMHAPATGVVEKIGLTPNARGDQTPAVFIKPHPGSSQDILYGAPQEIDHMTREDLVKAVQETGVVGLGGAAFPTHVKLALPEGKSVDTIIVNGCECEPYLTTDHRVMVEQPADVVAGTRIVLKALGAKRAILCVEDNKPEAAEALRNVLPPNEPIEVQQFQTKYPQGAEKMLTKALLNREVPSGGLPIDVGVAVFNVATLAQAGELLPKHQGLIERVVTVTGSAARNPGNYLMALGTPLSWILDQVGLQAPLREVILGGPMMGPSVSSMDVPVTKGVTGILLVAEDAVSTKPKRIFPCIKCAECVQVCPIHLNPSRLGMLARKSEYQKMEEIFHLNDCFECGCCSYVCPSNIPLAQYFRIAKTMNRERKAKQ